MYHEGKPMREISTYYTKEKANIEKELQNTYKRMKKMRAVFAQKEK